MTHCLRQQPLAQTARDTAPCISQSCLGPPRLQFYFICSPVHTFKPTRGSRCLAAARNSEWFLSFGPTIRHAKPSTPESAATAGYLLLVCPSQIPFPSGAISVSDQHLLDISAGMNWDMRDANNVRFLAVRGTIWVGDCQTTYILRWWNINCIIDEVPWPHFFYSC